MLSVSSPPVLYSPPLPKVRYFSGLFLFCQATIMAHDYKDDQDTILQMRYWASSPYSFIKLNGRTGRKEKNPRSFIQNTGHEVKSFNYFLFYFFHNIMSNKFLYIYIYIYYNFFHNIMSNKFLY